LVRLDHKVQPEERVLQALKEQEVLRVHKVVLVPKVVLVHRAKPELQVHRVPLVLVRREYRV